MELSEEWKEIKLDSEQFSVDDTLYIVHSVWVQQVNNTVRLFGIVENNSSGLFEVRHDEKRVSVSIKSLLHNISTVNDITVDMSLSDGVSINVGRNVDMDVNLYEAELMAEAESLEDARQFIKSRTVKNDAI